MSQNIVRLDEVEEEEGEVTQEAQAGMGGGVEEQELQTLIEKYGFSSSSKDRKVYYKTTTNRGKR